MDEKPRKRKVEPSDLSPEGPAEAEVSPDPSKTQAPPAPEVPVPYPDTARAADETSGSKSVKVDGKEVGLKEKSTYTQSSGDEAGTSGSGAEISRVDDVVRLGGETVSRLGREARRLMKYASGMGPDGYKLLMAALVIGLIGGYATSSLSCGRRVTMLRNQLLEFQDGFRDYPSGSEVGILPAGSELFGGFEITSVAWDLENKEVDIEVTNTASTRATPSAPTTQRPAALPPAAAGPSTGWPSQPRPPRDSSSPAAGTRSSPTPRQGSGQSG
jgi:hypothetical protein